LITALRRRQIGLVITKKGESKMDNKYLDPKEAIRLMLDGEALVDFEKNKDTFYSGEGGAFVYKDGEGYFRKIDSFSNLRRKPQKTRRPMTRWECLAWANSNEACGWFVKAGKSDWYCPQNWDYNSSGVSGFRRAKLKLDGSGVDESTITDFSVEDK
jgi:hypothetical protein